MKLKNESPTNYKPRNTHAIAADLATKEANFACGASAKLTNSIFADVVAEDSVIWQPDVYAKAREVADKLKINNVVDVGTGSGDKLVNFFSTPKYDTVGLDFMGSLDVARKKHPDRKWLECELTDAEDLAKVDRQLDGTEATVFILSDVIEHLTNPLPLLAWLRSKLMANERNRLVLSSPDRRRQGYPDPSASPPNDAHVREWSIDELITFLRVCGFKVNESLHTRSNEFDTSCSSSLLILSCTKAHYRAHLRNMGFPPESMEATRLLVTAEYAPFHVTGGIGTFVMEQKLNFGKDAVVLLVKKDCTDAELKKARRLEILPSPLLVPSSNTIHLLPEDLALRSVEQALFFMPQIKHVEYPDYQGLGVRIAQAKNVGLLAQNIKTIVQCHGMTHYLENATHTWLGLSHNGFAEKEKRSVELSDFVVFPTHFLRFLYAVSGFEIPEERVRLLRYPLNFSRVPVRKSSEPDTLVFFGKRTTMKGMDLFLEMVSENVAKLKAAGLTKVVVIGHGALPENWQEMWTKISSEFELVEYSSLGRSAAMDKIAELSTRSVIVMPYRGDNHPYALLDVAFAGGIPVMLNAGGVPELFSEGFRKDLLAEPTVDSLASKCIPLLSLDQSSFHRVRESYVVSMMDTQQGINDRVRVFDFSESHVDDLPDVTSTPAPLQEQYSEQGDAGAGTTADGLADEGNHASDVTDASHDAEVAEAAVVQQTSEVSIIVPVFNTDLKYIEDLIVGIERQLELPAEVIFVNDASERQYAKKLTRFLERRMDLPYRLISHSVNKGLAGARNTALNAARTPYIANVDSDDIPLPNFVKSIAEALRRNTNSAAAVPYLMAFDDGDDFNVARFNGYVYRPVGDGIITSQIDNILGHANSGYRVSALRSVDGWDESDKSMWEDLALFLKLRTNGYEISVIPTETCLYRVRKASMARTYRTWPAMQRIANNMSGLPRFENYRLQAMMRNYKHEHDQNMMLRSQLVESDNRRQASVDELRRWEQTLLERIYDTEAKLTNAVTSEQNASIQNERLTQSLADLNARLDSTQRDLTESERELEAANKSNTAIVRDFHESKLEHQRNINELESIIAAQAAHLNRASVRFALNVADKAKPNSITGKIGRWTARLLARHSRPDSED